MNIRVINPRDIPAETVVTATRPGITIKGIVKFAPSHVIYIYLDGLDDGTNLQIREDDYDKFVFTVTEPSAREVFDSWPIGAVFTLDDDGVNRVKLTDDHYIIVGSTLIDYGATWATNPKVLDNRTSPSIKRVEVMKDVRQ